MYRRQALKVLFGSGVAVLPSAQTAANTGFATEGAEGIIIDNLSKTLTLVARGGHGVSFPIAVGRVAMQWTGRTSVVRRVVNPWWQPPQIVRRDRPSLPEVVPPGPRNPLGTRALELARPEYAIHGTNDPSSIGRAVSYGCFRMHNHDIERVFDIVGVGTPVHIR